MFRRVHAIALNTFREAVRSKVLFAILFFAVLLILASLAFGELSLYEQERVIKDLGIVVITLFGALLAVYTGVSLLYKEIEKKTIYTIVSKPIERWHFLLGKYLGIALTMAIQVAIMAAIFGLLLVFRSIPIDASIVQAVLLIFVEVMVVAAVAMLFSAFSTPFLSGMLTASFFLLGNLYDNIGRFADEATSPVVRGVLAIARVVLPDLTLFNLSDEVTRATPVAWSYVAYAGAHGLFYIVMLLIVAALIFRRRDFI